MNPYHIGPLPVQLYFVVSNFLSTGQPSVACPAIPALGELNQKELQLQDSLCTQRSLHQGVTTFYF